MTRAMWVLGSKVKPTATTCGELSERKVVNIARWRSVRNASASLVSRVVAFAIGVQTSAGDNRSREGHEWRARGDLRRPQRDRRRTRAAAGARRHRGAGRPRRRPARPSRSPRWQTAGAAAVHVREFDADDLASHGAAGGRRSSPNTGRSAPRCWRSGSSAIRPAPRPIAAHAVAVVHTDYVAQVEPADRAGRQRCGRRARARSWCSRRWPACGCGAPTTSTARRRPGWTGSPAGWPTRCTASGVRLLLVRPGFVIGRMTEGMDPAPLSSTPPQVADATARALAQGPPQGVGAVDAAAVASSGCG